MLALGLLSGDADSSLAVRMVMDQGIKVIVLRFISPFNRRVSGESNSTSDLASRMGLKLIAVPNCHDYLDIVREPKFGRGSGMNPCIDCRIYLLRKAKVIADEEGADFIFTDEAIGQKPLSQHWKIIEFIEREAGLEGKVLRPLSAGLLPETEAERMGWVDRKALKSASGQRRKGGPIVKVSDAFDYPCPAGGCMLTDRRFAARLKDFLEHGVNELTLKDVNLLKIGRHFRVDGHKVIIGRDRDENIHLLTFASDQYAVLSPVSIPGPVGILENEGMESLETVASMVARYCDHGGKKVQLKVSSVFGGGTLEAEPMKVKEVEAYRVE
ncbi:MAG: hypothetical protein SA339_11540 [Methanomassiliicoccus sp.]|nr:hypothetical protein [Methanomassiliicoccus sp.]